MKTFSTLVFLAAMAASSLLQIQMALENHSWPSLGFRSKGAKSKSAKTVTSSCEAEQHPIVAPSYHSLMIHAARHYSAQNYATALAHYRRVLMTRPDDVAALSGEAWSLYYLGKEEQAAKDFQTLLKFNANDSWAREGMALCRHDSVSGSMTTCS